MPLLRFVLVCLLALPLCAQYTLEPAGACNAVGVADAVKAALEATGHQIKDSGGAVFVEVWLRKAIPSEKPAEEPRGSDFPSLPLHGFLGVIRYAKAGGDFRGQTIAAGVYTMRFGLQPEDGNHQGASPRRDHLLLVSVAADQDPAGKPVFDAIVALSKQASGTDHPSVLFLVAPESGAKFPSLHGGNHQVLQVKVGPMALGITLVGKAEE